jgi:hypothetical protein
MIAPTSSAHIVPAKIQAERSARRVPRASVEPPADRPQRWQKRACGKSCAPQPSQLRWPRLAPQLLQNRPLAAPPQEGQVVVVDAVIAAGR